MADILERLRGNGSWESTTIDGKKKVWLGLHEGDIREAADEIERLRAENANLRAALPQQPLPEPRDMIAPYQWGYPNHPGVAGPCDFKDGSSWDGFRWVTPPHTLEVDNGLDRLRC